MTNTPVEREADCRGGNQRRLTFYDDVVLAGKIAHPKSQALSAGRQRWSYSQLNQAISTMSKRMIAAQAGRGSRVAIYLDKSPEFVVAMFAAVRIGAIAVPINSTFAAVQVRHIVDSSGAQFMVSRKRQFGLLPGEVRSMVQHLSAPDLNGEAMASELNGSNPSVAYLSRELSLQSAQRSDSDLALLLYTSGSTGLPKGVMLNHRNLVCGCESVASYLGLSEQDAVIAALPLSFDYGLSQVGATLYSGGRVHLHEYLSPMLLANAIEEHQITGLAAVPPMWIDLVRSKAERSKFRSIRYATNSGGRVDPDLIKKIREKIGGAAFISMYGLTEAFRSTYVPPARLSDKAHSIGVPIPQATLLIIDEFDHECPAGAVGELVHAGPLVAQGYWRRPHETSRKFFSIVLDPRKPNQTEHAVRSGDLAWRDEEGFFHFVGRKDEMLKILGHRLSPQEVESMVVSTGLVESAVAFATTDCDGQSRLEVAIECACDTEANCHMTALLTKLRKDFPRHMIPARVHCYTQLPRNSNGKLDRPNIQAKAIECDNDRKKQGSTGVGDTTVDRRFSPSHHVA